MKGNANQIGKDMSCQAFGHLFSLSMHLAIFTVSWTVGAFSSTCIWPHKSQELEILLQQPKDLQGLPILWRTLPLPHRNNMKGLMRYEGIWCKEAWKPEAQKYVVRRDKGDCFKRQAQRELGRKPGKEGRGKKKKGGANQEIERNYGQGGTKKKMVDTCCIFYFLDHIHCSE